MMKFLVAEQDDGGLEVYDSYDNITAAQKGAKKLTEELLKEYSTEQVNVGIYILHTTVKPATTLGFVRERIED